MSLSYELDQELKDLDKVYCNQQIKPSNMIKFILKALELKNEGIKSSDIWNIQ